MASESIPELLPREIRQLLAGLRWRIRAYVWLQGISLAIGWLGLTFWCGLALDYLPVLAGVGEMPIFARAILLAAIGAVLAFILYRWVFRRIFVRLADRSMAMLLERRNRELGESLITAVELSARGQLDSERSREMLTATRDQAVTQIRDLQLKSVFNFRPLALSMGSALVLAATIGAFYAVNANAWVLGISRLYFLKDDPWPRNARIEVAGVELHSFVTADESNSQIVPFHGQVLKVAKGSSLALLVRADTSQKVVPELCVVHYRTAEGDYGRVNMTRIGRAGRNNLQLYRYEGKPFDGVLSDIEFDVVGYDHRVSGYRLQAVDSPAVVSVDVDCEFPPYMVDEKLSQWLPRKMPLTSGMQLPRGTKLTVHARSNKPLTQVALSNPDANSSETIQPNQNDSTTFTHLVNRLEDHLTLDIALTDTDEVRSERPYRIHISGIEDTPPVIEMRLRGIGSAVTPNVLIPTVGKITDDYGLSKAWLETILNNGEPKEFPLRPSSSGETELAVDFREQRGQPNGMTLETGAKLHLVVKATDRRDLGSGPNQASGDNYQLDVVSPEQLLTLLEARELALRRRFEQVISELTETRDMLIRIRAEGPSSATAIPDATDKAAALEKAREDKKDSKTTDPAVAEAARLQQIWSLRLLRARQSLLQSQKSAQEVLGISASFLDIYEELINNRVDTEDRKLRLKDQVATPLQSIVEKQFPELDGGLEKLAAAISAVETAKKFDAEDPASANAAQATVDQANRILRDLDAVLQKMLDLESFNELLDIVRGLIDDQERISTETKKEQKKSVLDLLKE